MVNKKIRLIFSDGRELNKSIMGFVDEEKRVVREASSETFEEKLYPFENLEEIIILKEKDEEENIRAY